MKKLTQGILGLRSDATIGVFGHYGLRNLGDEATIAAVVQNLRERLPDASIVGFSSRPADTSARLAIPAYPIQRLPSQPSSSRLPVAPTGSTTRDATERIKVLIKKIPLSRAVVRLARSALRFVPSIVAEARFLRRSYTILKDVDLLMIAGSNQLMDTFGGCKEGPWGFPYTLLKWTTTAKLAGSKVVCVSVGAGPITSKLSRKMIKLALRSSDYSSLRDTQSKELLQTLGIEAQSSVFPDLAYSLRTPNRTRRILTDQHRRKPIVGINPMPVYDNTYWYISNPEKYEHYVVTLARVSAALLREGYPLVFWGTQPNDQGVIKDILAHLQTEIGGTINPNSLISNPSSVDELLDVIDTLDIVVATRFHGVVLSLFAGKAVLSICYHGKMDALMREMGQSEYSLLFDGLTTEDLLERFKRLEQNAEQEVAKIKRKTGQYQQILATQYDMLFGPPVRIQSHHV